MQKVDFSYYKPINQKQADFHKSKAINKLLIGSYRGGKTYPAIHESCFICNDNPGHEFAIFRNTDRALKTNVQKDFLAVARRANAIKLTNSGREMWKESTGDLTWWNDLKIRFRTLAMDWEELKGMNLCGFFIDDPNVDKYKEVISSLFTRLTDPPGVQAKYFETIICANYEGHDWLWQKYMRQRKEGGDGMFAYWFFKTQDNTTLSKDYIKIQESLHNEAWMKRYIHGDQQAYVGLVYDEYDPQYHDRDLSWCFDDHNLKKILVIDLGITHPTVVLKAATDYNNIYFYDELYQANMRTHDLGDYLVSVLDSKENFDALVIDPKSCAREQTSGTSPRKILKDDFGIHNIKLANNNVRTGIQIQKDLMTVRKIYDEKTGEDKMITHFYIDPNRCPNLSRELETLKWKEPEYNDFDELAYKEEPIDKDNDATDCSRYGSVYLKKYMTGLRIQERQDINKKLIHWEDRFNKLKIYKKRPDVIHHQRAKLVKAMRNNKMAILKEMHAGRSRILT